MPFDLATPVVFVALVGKAYHAKYSPAVRVEAVRDTVDRATKINNETLAIIPTFPELDKKETEAVRKEAGVIRDRKEALFNAMLDAEYIQAEIDKSGPFRRHVFPNFTCSDGERSITLKDLEKDASDYKRDVLVSSRKMKQLVDKEKEKKKQRAETRKITSSQNPFVQPPSRTVDKSRTVLL